MVEKIGSCSRRKKKKEKEKKKKEKKRKEKKEKRTMKKRKGDEPSKLESSTFSDHIHVSPPKY